MPFEYAEDIVKEEYTEDLANAELFDETRLKCGEVFLHHREGDFTFVCVLCQQDFPDLSSFGEHIRNLHALPKDDAFVSNVARQDVIQPKSEPLDEGGTDDERIGSQDEDESIGSIEDGRCDDGDQQQQTDASDRVGRMFCCFSCGKTFVRIDSYRLHYRIHHPDMIAVDNSTKYSSDQTSFVPKVPQVMLCKYCLQTFSDTTSYHSHMENAHRDKLYTCPHCLKSFTRGDKRNHHVKARKHNKCPNDISRHVGNHLHAKSFKCPHCPKAFSMPDILEHHVDTHLKRYACRVCDKKFVRRTNLIRHEPIHTKERPFRCNECGLNFKDSSQMGFHLRQHANMNTFKCSHCEESFRCSQNLKEHVLTHQLGSQDSCDVEQHIRDVSSLVKGETLLPEGVKSEIETDSELIDEKMEERTTENFTSPVDDIHHEDNNQLTEDGSNSQPGTSQQSTHDDFSQDECDPIAPKDTLCQYCLQIFDNITAYHAHTEYAHPNRIFTCPFCPQSFSEKTERNIHFNAHGGDLGYHVNIHLNVKRFKCRFCNKNFTHRSALVFHMLKHREKRQCPHCEKSFACPKYLKEHIISHGEDRPFSCEICGQKFKKKRILRDHKISHSDVRKYKCKICAKTFKQRWSVNRHLKKEHSEVSIKANSE